MGGEEPLGLNILVVEDYFALAESLCVLLEQEGCRVIGPAPTVEAALELIEGNRVDGAILDVNLRGRSVSPVARRLREMGRPLVFLTGHSDLGGLVEEFAGYRWLSKPAEERELMQALREMAAPSA